MRGLACAAALAVGTTALAHSGVDDPVVMKRMVGMTDIAAHTKLLGRMAKGQDPFDAAAANAALDGIATEAARIPAQFSDRVLHPRSEALPVIWERFETFTARAEDLREIATEARGTVTEAPDLDRVMRRIGKSCSACHEAFRK
ncbi:cytochrome C [Sulfitobacter alexandrii]|uniref:Cytochrome C n=1 Tax=Sulfitobacter alexandrii TaxID=1917485 RepID=A0A1J0WJU2_9RHOB|nr:cytochrome c [Sulfitobacter alexandrii]APE44601.1 cytochrome C [Sulfitobacter alexandrii]